MNIRNSTPESSRNNTSEMNFPRNENTSSDDIQNEYYKIYEDIKSYEPQPNRYLSLEEVYIENGRLEIKDPVYNEKNDKSLKCENYDRLIEQSSTESVL